GLQSSKPDITARQPINNSSIHRSTEGLTTVDAEDAQAPWWDCDSDSLLVPDDQITRLPDVKAPVRSIAQLPDSGSIQLMLFLRRFVDDPACVGPYRRRRDRRPQERQPPAHRAVARQRSRGGSRLRFAASSRGHRGAGRSLRYFHSIE